MKKIKPFFHKLSQKEIEKLIKSKKTIGYLLENYRQPGWCNYPDALSGVMGCWSLTDCTKNGLRTKISKKYCKTCDCFKKTKT